MSIPLLRSHLTSRPLDIFLGPVFWKPSLTNTRAFTFFVMFWNKTYANTVWIGLDNMVFDAIFVKQIHSGLSMAASGETRFELQVSVNIRTYPYFRHREQGLRKKARA